jgi:NADH-quinone oxidoreductase subunit G
LLSLVGNENFYHGISKKEYQLTKTILSYQQSSGVTIPSLKQIETADAILVLGEDLVNTAPMIALALRQAVRNMAHYEAKNKGIPLWNDAPVRELAQDTKSPLFIATTCADSLDEIAKKTYRASSGDIAGLGFAIAKSIESKSTDVVSHKTDIQALADRIAMSLKNAKKPLIISGVSSGNESVIQAALNTATSLMASGSDVMLCMVLPECNSMGLALFPGKSFEDSLDSQETGEIDTLIVLENDLYKRADEETVNTMFDKSKQIIVLAQLPDKTTEKANFVLPAATFAESEGTFVNNEGRAQRFYKAVVKDQIRESWKWIEELIKIQNGEGRWSTLDNITESMVNDLPLFSKLKDYKPGADFRMLNVKIPRQTIRYSGRTAMNANIAVSEKKLPEDQDSPLAFSMEGQPENPPSSLVPFYWTPGWNSVQALYSYIDEPNGSMKGGDPGIRLIEQENNGKFHKL